MGKLGHGPRFQYMTDIETQNPDKAKHWGNVRLNLWFEYPEQHLNHMLKVNTKKIKSNLFLFVFVAKFEQFSYTIFIHNEVIF